MGFCGVNSTICFRDSLKISGYVILIEKASELVRFSEITISMIFYERLPKLCFLKPILRWTRVVANINKSWKATWAIPKTITLVTTFQFVLFDVL